MAILTMSRQFGSGSREIRRAIVDALHYDYVDKQVIHREIGKVGGNWSRWAEELDEVAPTIWEKSDWSFKGFRALVQSILLDHASRDNVVLTGRGAGFLLSDVPYAYRIRVVAPIEDRITRISEREHLDRDNARWLAEKIERERRNFVYAMHGRRSEDPKFYDAVYDTGVNSCEEIAEIIIKALAKKDEVKTECAQDNLRMRAAAARVKAGIIINPKLYVPVLEVDFVGTELRLSCIVHNLGQKKAIAEAAEKLAGNVPIKCEFRLRD